jgi:hypothetical protein
MSGFEDYAVHREGLADAAEPDTWTRQQPDAPGPYALTPEGEAEADTWTRRAPYQLTARGEAAAGRWARYLAVARDAWARPSMEPEFEAEAVA